MPLVKSECKLCNKVFFCTVSSTHKLQLCCSRACLKSYNLTRRLTTGGEELPPKYCEFCGEPIPFIWPGTGKKIDNYSYELRRACFEPACTVLGRRRKPQPEDSYYLNLLKERGMTLNQWHIHNRNRRGAEGE